MKFLNAFLILFLVSSVPNKEIKLEKTQKVLSTFSGNIDNNSSFHLILTKNLKTNKHNIIPYVFDEVEIREMPIIEFDNKFHLNSFHVNNGIITLITQTKIDKEMSIDVIDFNTITGKSIRSNKIFTTEDLKTTVRSKNKNVLLYVNEDELSLVTINSAIDFKESFLVKNKENQEFIDRLLTKSIDPINTDEYSKDGSISEFKAYLSENQLLVTQDDQLTGVTNILKLSTNVNGSLSIKPESFNVESDKSFKKNSSYLMDNKLFQLRVGKENTDLNIFDFDKDDIKRIDLGSSPIMDISSNKEAAMNYQKEASKNRNQPTITVNSASNNSFSIKFNFENKNTYRYFNNWWWYHDWMWQQQLIQDRIIQQQQRQFINNLPRFGPSDNVPEIILYNKTSKKKDNSFEIGLNSNIELLSVSELQTVFREVDKKSYIEKLEEDKYLRHTSSTFTDSTCSYITYNRKTKTFVIKSKPLD